MGATWDDSTGQNECLRQLKRGHLSQVTPRVTLLGSELAASWGARSRSHYVTGPTSPRHSRDACPRRRLHPQVHPREMTVSRKLSNQVTPRVTRNVMWGPPSRFAYLHAFTSYLWIPSLVAVRSPPPP